MAQGVGEIMRIFPALSYEEILFDIPARDLSVMMSHAVHDLYGKEYYAMYKGVEDPPRFDPPELPDWSLLPGRTAPISGMLPADPGPVEPGVGADGMMINPRRASSVSSARAAARMRQMQARVANLPAAGF